MDKIEKSEQVKKLEEELRIATIKNQLDIEKKRTFNTSVFGKILIGIFGITAFLTVTFVSMQIFSNYGIDPKIYPIFSLIAGAFTTYIVLMASGIVKEFTIKGGSVELSTKLQEQIKNVQNDVKDTKKDFSDKYERLIQHVNTRLDNVISNSNSNVQQINLGDLVGSLANLVENLKSEKYAEFGVNSKLSAKPTKSPIDSEEVKKTIASLTKTQKELNNLMGKISAKPIPFDPDKKLKDANYSYYQGNYLQAIEIYNEILDHRPKDDIAMSNKGLTLWKLGRYDEALKYVNEALVINPKFTDALNVRGLCLMGLGKYDEAVKNFEDALAIDSNHATSMYNIACIKSLQGKKSEALDLLENTIKIDQTFKEKAKNDTDFNNIRDEKQFKDLVG